MTETASAASRALVERAADWLMAQALNDTELETLVRGACERLHAAGVPITRVQLSFSMLHPLYRGIGYTWRRGQGLQVDAYRHTPQGSAQPERYTKSPYFHLKRHGLDHMRRRLDTGGTAEFPIFDDLRKEGLTDYIAFATSFEMGKAQGMMGSWSTDQRGGFTDAEIEALLGIQNTLAVACKMAARSGVAKSALSTYLGAQAGERVLSGQIKRGDGETTRAAIVWGDLRNSTELADQLGRQAYIDSLNGFFDATAGAVADAGGEILSFIGDGFLAIFPSGRNQKDSSEACKLALSAALEATHRMTEHNRQRAAADEPPLGYGLSLHIGNVMFGNVGLAERLSFSVFGSTVNEVARLEGLTKKFTTPIVASEEFTNYCGGDWEQLGRETLRGVNAPMAVFRPVLPGGELTPARVIQRSRVRDFSDAEAVILLHRDSPA
ncbi:MAG TPA: adenylate/guanylate cyclase domain-containing protein [Candidatus Acidoferrum sp.]|nr:adenylate/guanylate cyclase domain-containing protein [Candidatus Acidoferrum sp.]